MASSTSAFSAETPGPEYYEWQVPGKMVRVRIDLDVVDRIGADALRGFGSVPRKASEIGGILLGYMEPHSGGTTVRITDYEPVPISNGPSPIYHPAGADREAFISAVRQWNWEMGKRTYAVGYVRSHTRGGLGLTPDDVELFNECFSEASSVVLLVKPFATRASAGGFFFREGGSLRTDSSYSEFPFRRRELIAAGEAEVEETGGEPPRLEDASAGAIPSMATAGSVLGIGPKAAEPMPSDNLKFGIPTGTTDEKTGRKLRSGWVWIPLSFIFLLLGVVLGFQVALSVRSRIPAGFREDPYALNLSISPAGDSLHVRWDRNSPAIQSATRGWLIIQDGGNQKSVDLDMGQLQNGSVIYRKGTGDIRFRLEVLAGGRVTVAESLDFKPSSK